MYKYKKSPSLFVNTISFSLISYAIIKHGRMLELYHWLLLAIFILSYAVDIVITVGHLVAYLPAIAVYSDGIIGKYISAKLTVRLYFSVFALKLLGILFI